MIGVLAGSLSPLGVGAGSSEYLPGGVGGLVLALDASRLTGYAEGAPVLTVPDRLGKSAGAYQNVPTFAPTYISSRLNGLSVIRFDGNAITFLNLDNITGILAGGNTTVTGAEAFWVGKVVASRPTTGDTTGLWSHHDQSNEHLPWVDGKIYDAFVSNRRLEYAPPAPHSLGDAFIHNPSFDASASDITAYFNNTLAASGNAAGVPLYSVTRIGRNNGGANYHGDLGELLYYNRRLTTAERTAVATFLGAKWGVPL
jgi:hypothetical protein